MDPRLRVLLNTALQVHLVGCDPLVDFYSLRSSAWLADYCLQRSPKAVGRSEVGEQVTDGHPLLWCCPPLIHNCWGLSLVPCFSHRIYSSDGPLDSVTPSLLQHVDRLAWAAMEQELPSSTQMTIGIREFLLILSYLGSFLAHKESL